MKFRARIVVYIVIVAVVAIVFLWMRNSSIMTAPGGATTTTSGSTTVATSSAPVIPPGWKTVASTTADGVPYSLAYPPQLPTKYIYTQDWPPQVKIVAGPFSCNAGGAGASPVWPTKPVTVNGHTYCRTAEGDGAAGSIYTTYSYAMPLTSGPAAGKVATLSFVLRAVQCGNFDEPQMSACTAERASYNVDQLADQIAQTLQVK